MDLKCIIKDNDKNELQIFSNRIKNKVMTNEEKDLLLKDLCARLPYGVIVQETFQDAQRDIPVWDCGPHYIKDHPEKVKPYLRPMSSMTEEEMREYKMFIEYSYNDFTSESTQCVYVSEINKYIDWLNSHHFDYCGLIEKGIALAAPEGMYNTKTE